MTIEADITKQYGKVFLTGSDIVDGGNLIIPISPSLDIITGGGISEGSLNIITGHPKMGKTTLCLDFAATAQKPEYKCKIGRPEGRHVYFFSIENRLKPKNLRGINGLDISPERFTIIQSTPGNILTAEKQLAICEKLINEKPGDIFIIDSFSALCTENDLTSDLEDRTRPDAPLLLSKFLKRISAVTGINKTIVLGITHLIANQGAGHAQYAESSGRKLQYHLDLKLKTTYAPAWKIGEVQVGIDSNFICEENYNASPGGKCVTKIRFGYGIDKAAELAQIGVDIGLIQKGGAWYTLPSGEKIQGLDKLSTVIVNNKALYNELYSIVRDTLIPSGKYENKNSE